MRCWWVFLITCACALAHAQPHGEAQRRLERGASLYEIQDYDGAIAEYQAGYLLEQRAEFLYGIGQAYRMKGDCERAIRSYTAVLRAPDGAALAAAARQNIDRCEPRQPPSLAGERSPPASATYTPPPAALGGDTRWYRDALGNALVIGGVAMILGGSISWKIGRDRADRTYESDSYDAWFASSRQASHADTMQRVGVGAAIVGGAALFSGVMRLVWPKNLHATAAVTPASARAGVSVAF